MCHLISLGGVKWGGGGGREIPVNPNTVQLREVRDIVHCARSI